MYNVDYNKCMSSSLERLVTCDPYSNTQQFRWTSENRILNTFTKKCLGVGSKTVGRTLQWLKCQDDNVLQKWECHGDTLLGLKNESLYLAVMAGVPVISKSNGTKSKWTIHGTLNSICSKPYEGIVQTSQSELWTGLNKLDVTSGWQWSNGQPLRYLKWLSGYPTTQPGYNCGVLKNAFGSEWSNAPCSEKHGYVCQRGHSVPSLPPVKTDELWIGFNDRKTQMLFEWSDQSSVPFASWEVREPSHSALHAEDCVLMRGEEGKWADDVCEKKYGFVCKKPTSSKASNNDTAVTSPGCKTGWTRYGYYCYMAGSETKTFEEAKQMCQKADSELVDISSRVENAFLVSLVGARPEKYFWIGLSNLKDLHSFEWTNSNKVPYTHFNAGMPGRKQGCVAMTTGLVAGLWDVLSCSNKEKYILVNTGFCHSPWIPYSGNCYLLHRNKKTWLEARDSCLREGGDLLSIISKEEQSFVITQLGYLKTDELWIGFNDRKIQMLFEWSDQSSVPFASWEVREPSHSALHAEDCVLMRGEEGKWADDICEKKYGFVCKKPTSSKASNNDTAVTSPGCKTGWTRYGYYCYMAGSETKTFEEAKQMCQKADSELVDISSRVENAFLVSLVGARPEKYFWIGLSNLKDLHSFEWTNSNKVPYTHFNAGMPGRKQGCVAMTTGLVAGLWDVLSCSNKEKYICKQRADGLVTTLAPSTASPLGCPEDWTSLVSRDFCAKYFNVPSNQMKTWDEALDFCREIGGDLLSIHHEADIPWKQGGVYPAWIGYRMYDPTVGFVWSDDSSSSYQSWATDEPNNLNNIENCVEMRISYWDSDGAWNDVNCEDKKDWYCQIRKGKTPKEVNITDPYYNETEDGWIQFKGSQYYVSHYSALAVQDARAFCKKSHGDLVVISDQDERVFLWHQAKNSHNDLIIGLTVDLDGTYQWIDGSPLVFQAWETNQPAFKNSEERCVKMTTSQDPAIASVPTEVPRTFVKLGNSSFKVIQENLTWSEAKGRCEKEGAHLASIRDFISQAYLELQIYRAKQPLWIGLSSAQTNGYFLWANNWPMSMEKWASSEPRPNRPCAYMDIGGEWKTTFCNETYYSVCEQTTDVPPIIPAQHPGHCPKEEDDSPLRWIPFRDSCYAFVTDGRSWSRAARLCMTWGASLVSIRDEDEQKFIERILMVLDSSEDFWIALFHNQKGHWLWSDNTVVDYTNWADENDYEDEYRDHSWSPDCGLIDSKSKKWKKRHCDYSHFSFICKTAKVISPTIKAPQEGASLVSIRDEDEQKFIERILMVLDSSEDFWIALFHNQKGHWLWSDNTVVDYTNWADENDYEDEYRDHSWNPDCGLIDSKSKKWKKRHCDYSHFSFICKTAKVISPTIKAPQEGPEPHKINTGLAVFLSIAVIGILGALAFMYYRNSKRPLFENLMDNNRDAAFSVKDNKTLIGNIEITE
ncbi:macrophage mannose receptor 1-like protein [Labeo rohita]|uniref:Macrophage mannose receptor 1-like protein n=1 Tax=Labeo rohita TaxID=84645 RepID=A0A498MMY5_LABRO|nr:macrophage mannose receptor 1-like protein [Labeo rohita]